MPVNLQEYLARVTQKDGEDLQAALKRLPEDKRAWSPMGAARPALHQIAEIALINGAAAEVIAAKAWPENYDMAGFPQRMAELAQDESAVLALLQEHTRLLVAALRATSSEDFDLEIATPFGEMSLLRIMGMAHWNMSYHEGQINYIASMLG